MQACEEELTPCLLDATIWVFLHTLQQLRRGVCFAERPPAALLHLAALRNGNVLHRLSFGIGYCSRVLNLCHNIHAFNDISKYNVLAV